MIVNLMQTLNSAKFRRMVQLVMVVGTIAAMLVTSFAFADDSEIATAIKDLMDSVYGDLISIAPVVAAVYLAVIAVIMLTGGRDAVEKARKGLLIALGAIALIYLAPVLLIAIKTALGKNGGTTKFSKLKN